MAAGRLVTATRAAGAGLALLALAAWWQPGLPTPEPASATPPLLAAGVAAGPPAWAPAEVVRDGARGGEPAVAWPDLPALLAAPAQSLRATLQAALRERASGGRLYARALARQCAALRTWPEPATSLDLNDPRAQRALAQRTALATGCDQMLAGEWLALASVPADEPGVTDPLLQTLESEASPARLAALLARPDPLLMEELGSRLLGDSPVFDGQRFDGAGERSLLEAALRLLPCDFGLVCDERDPGVWQACLRGEGCHGSRTEQVMAEEAAGDPARVAAIAALRSRLRDAVRARAVERFLP